MKQQAYGQCVQYSGMAVFESQYWAAMGKPESGALDLSLQPYLECGRKFFTKPGIPYNSIKPDMTFVFGARFGLWTEDQWASRGLTNMCGSESGKKALYLNKFYPDFMEKYRNDRCLIKKYDFGYAGNAAWFGRKTNNRRPQNIPSDGKNVVYFFGSYDECRKNLYDDDGLQCELKTFRSECRRWGHCHWASDHCQAKSCTSRVSRAACTSGDPKDHQCKWKGSCVAIGPTNAPTLPMPTVAPTFTPNEECGGSIKGFAKYRNSPLYLKMNHKSLQKYCWSQEEEEESCMNLELCQNSCKGVVFTNGRCYRFFKRFDQLGEELFAGDVEKYLWSRCDPSANAPYLPRPNLRGLSDAGDNEKALIWDYGTGLDDDFLLDPELPVGDPDLFGHIDYRFQNESPMEKTITTATAAPSALKSVPKPPGLKKLCGCETAKVERNGKEKIAVIQNGPPAIKPGTLRKWCRVYVPEADPVKYARLLRKWGPTRVILRTGAYSRSKRFPSGRCYQNAGHAMVLVGWDRRPGHPPVWILRNSMGPNSRDGGFAYVKMNCECQEIVCADGNDCKRSACSGLRLYNFYIVQFNLGEGVKDARGEYPSHCRP